MDRLIYTALSAMNSSMDRQRTIANNLANASTPGFRQEIFAVTAATLRDGSPEARSMARGSVRGADLAPAHVNQTGRVLDVAVAGEALIAFQAPSGAGNVTEVYSRRGDLQVSPNGVLENGEGLIVLGQGGPITVPAGSSLSIAADGTVLASDPNAQGEGAETIGQIKLVSPEGSQLVKGIDTYLKVPGGGVLAPDPTAQLQSGALEQSNVVMAKTMVDMIEAQRAFEQRARIISTAGELDEAGSRLMSLS